MVIVGSIKNGTVGDANTLYFKSHLDGVASIAFSSTLGVGVSFSALSVLVIQGILTLLASHRHFRQEPAVLSSVTDTGGLMILGNGINLLEMARIRIGNFLPALLNAILRALFFAG